MIFPESSLAHKYLDGLKGLEIGGSAHNPFGLDTLNVDLFSETDTIYKKKEIELCGKALHVDIVAPGDKLPFADKSVDFIVSSHVIEHFYDPVSALLEWQRVATKYIFCIVPHMLRTFDSDKTPSDVSELLKRHFNFISLYKKCDDKHWSFFTPENFKSLCNSIRLNIIELQDPDDKVGNGFSVVISI